MKRCEIILCIMFIILTMWCLLVVEACPSSKRPRAEVQVYHFEDKKDAEDKKIQLQLEFICDNKRKLDTEEKARMKSDVKLTDQERETFFEHLQADYYQDSYMDMDPLSIRLFEIEPVPSSEKPCLGKRSKNE